MGTLSQDVRYGARMMLKRPGVTLMAVLTLALGVGANAAIFSVVNAVLLSPLPFRDPERLVAVWQTVPARGNDETNFTEKAFLDYRRENQAFEDMAAYTEWSYNLTGGGQAERLDGVQVSAGLFSTLGGRAKLGRVLQEGEDLAGNHRVVVISHKLWQRRFNADPHVVGQTLTLDGETRTVVGVMPADFQFPGRDAEVWVPMATDPAKPDNTKGMYQVIARLKPDVNLAQAQARMDSLAQHFAAENPDDNRDRGINLVPLHRQIVGDTQTPLLIMLGAVGLVLLIACANVANLQLARASARQKEVAIKMALGANRGRLVRQFLTESLLLALAGGALGMMLAVWCVDALVALSPAGIPRLDEVAVDGRVLAVMLAVTALTGVVFGLAPALQASRPDMNAALKEGGKGAAAGGGRHGLRRLLVVSEVALSLVLLIGAGLLIRSFIGLRAVDPGFTPERVVTLPIWLSPLKYTTAPQQAQYSDLALARLRALPGVEAAGAAAFLPLQGADANASFVPEGWQATGPGELPVASVNLISPGYFRAMGIGLLAGRDFEERDHEQAPRVAVVNETLAATIWPGEAAVGKRFQFGRGRAGMPWFTVVGVVRDVRANNLHTEPGPQFYMPHAQSPFALPALSFAVRAASDPTPLVSALRGEILAVDQDQPVYDIKTMNERLTEAVAVQRFQLTLLGAFAALAMILAAVGIYGVISYSVAERTHEIGVRMALGAQPSNVLGMVLRQGMTLVLVGVALGLGASFALTRFMESLLFQTGTKDPLTFVAIPLLLAGVALLASYIPARRAMKVDPMIALRGE